MIAEPSRKANEKSDRRARGEFIGFARPSAPRSPKKAVPSLRHTGGGARWCGAAHPPQKACWH